MTLPANYICGLGRQRSWQFTTGIYTVGAERTDFWCEPSADEEGVLTSTLHGVSEFSAAQNGWAARHAMETRLLQLNRLVGRTGCLITDVGTARQRTFPRMTLQSVKMDTGDAKSTLGYDLAFTQPAPGGVARGVTLVPPANDSAVCLDSEICIVQFDAQDRATYAEVFNGPFVHIPNGPAYELITVSAIRLAIHARGVENRRQKREAVIRDLGRLKGLPFNLSVGGSFLATGYLMEVSWSTLNLPDTVIFDLKFQTGIVEG